MVCIKLWKHEYQQKSLVQSLDLNLYLQNYYCSILDLIYCVFIAFGVPVSFLQINLLLFL